MKRSLVVLFALSLVLVAFAPALAEGDGKSLYESKCGLCHGKDGVAKKMAANSANLNDPAWQESTTLETIQQVISEGKGKMKPFSEKLDEAQIKLIAEYVLTLK